MRWLADGFAGSFATVASSVLRTQVEVRLTAAAAGHCAAEPRALNELTSSYVLAAPPTPGTDEPVTVCLEFSSALAVAMVERRLGAAAPDPGAGDRPLTAMERRILLRLAEGAAVSLSAAWPGDSKPALTAEIQPVGSDAAGCGRAVVVTFEVTFLGHVGTMRLCAAGGVLDAWITGDFAARGAPALLEVTAAIEGVRLDDAELAELAAGDLLVTEVPADGEVIVRIGGIPKFAARLGTADGRKLLTITRRLDPPRREP